MAEAAASQELTAAAARKRRMELRWQKVMNTKGDIYSRKLIGGGTRKLLQEDDVTEPPKGSLQPWASCSLEGSASLDSSLSSSTSAASSSFPRSFSAPSSAVGHAALAQMNALTASALKNRFRRPQFRRLKGHKENKKKNKRASKDGNEDKEILSSDDDVSSETSSSGTSTSSDEDAMEAVVSAATSLLREEMTMPTNPPGLISASGAYPLTSTPAPAPQGPGSAATTSGSVHNKVPSQCVWPPSSLGLPGDHCPSNGVLSVCGRRREMEDAVSMVPAFSSVACHSLVGCQGVAAAASGSAAPETGSGICQLHMFAVFDGHGGSQAAQYCAANLSRALGEELHLSMEETERTHADGTLQNQPSLETMQANWSKALVTTFGRMDAEISGHCYPRRYRCNMSGECGHDPLAEETVGTTAVVSVLTQRHIIVANCGDSRAVLCRGGKAIALSKDHKPDREDEMKRIEAAGGRVVFWNGYRVLGVLAMSRAIGDRYLKPYVIPEPEVTFTERHDEDECLILASDGLWDVINNDTACDLATKCLTTTKPEEVDAAATAGGASAALAGAVPSKDEAPAALAAALLTRMALARGSSDNTSVVVIDLRQKQQRK